MVSPYSSSPIPTTFVGSDLKMSHEWDALIKNFNVHKYTVTNCTDKEFVGINITHDDQFNGSNKNDHRDCQRSQSNRSKGGEATISYE